MESQKAIKYIYLLSLGALIDRVRAAYLVGCSPMFQTTTDESHEHDAI
jgi:hypothetical protein